MTFEEEIAQLQKHNIEQDEAIGAIGTLMNFFVNALSDAEVTRLGLSKIQLLRTSADFLSTQPDATAAQKHIYDQFAQLPQPSQSKSLRDRLKVIDGGVKV